jgi:uncharacterized membrane-anchored protein YitT (DUF2179 family)
MREFIYIFTLKGNNLIMKKKDTFWIIVTLPYIYFALGFIFLFIGLQTYFDGYHGVDLMFNRCLIGLMKNDSGIMEQKEVMQIRDGKVTDISPLELYSRALSSLNNSIKFLIIAGILFGVGIGLLLREWV